MNVKSGLKTEAANKAALPRSDLASFLIGLVIFFTRLPSPYNCLGICPRDIVIY